MKKTLLFIFLLTLICPFTVNAFPEFPEVTILKKDMPKDVCSFIDRTIECHHWGGEEPYNKERAKEIRKAVEKIKCNDLFEDGKKLRIKYKDNKVIIERLDKVDKNYQ